METHFLDEKMKIPGLDDQTVLDFWRWAYSEVLNNTNRGIFAEFVVGNALGVLYKPRKEWEEYDLEYRDSAIEVKSASYIQIWEQKKLSDISFDIAPKKLDNTKIPNNQNKSKRHADCYVFCLYNEKKKGENFDQTKVFNINKWLFFVATTKSLNDKFARQKSISLTRLQEHCGPALVYHELKTRIDLLIDNPNWKWKPRLL